MKTVSYLSIAYLALASTSLADSLPTRTAANSCIDPMLFGAVPDDGLDDRAALQAAVNQAIAEEGEVCLGPGNWHLSRPAGGGQAAIASLRIAGAKGVAIRGVGPATSLRMLGSGRFGDWRLLDIREGASDVEITDLSLDGSERSDTEEQTHLLHLSGPVDHIRIERVTFTLPVLAGMSGGDCVRLLGNSGQTVADVTMRDLIGIECDRSFIAIQRAVHRLRVEDSRSIKVGDQAIDFEPTGSVGVSDIEFVNNSFARGANAQGGFTVSIGGDGAAVAERIRLVSTQIVDGGVHIIDAHEVTLEDVSIHSSGSSNTPTLLIRKRAKGIRLVGSTVARPSHASAAPLISVHHQSGAIPSDVTIERSSLVQGTSSTILHIESLRQVSVLDSVLEYAGQPGAFDAINARGILGSNESIVIAGNRFDGALRGVARVSEYSPQYPIGAVVVTGNTALDLTTYVLRFQGTPRVEPIVEDNEFSDVPIITGR